MTRLGDIATYVNGFAFKPSDWSNEGLPIIRIQDLTGNSYQANRYNGSYHPKYEVNDGDVLISWSASLGVYVWKGEKAVLNQHIFKVVFDKSEVDKNFFVHQVQNILENAASEAHGATMKHLTKPVFDALPFYLPNIEKQKEIASVLDKVTELIALRKEQLVKLDQLVKSRFIELFGDVANTPKYSAVPLGTICTTLSGGTPTTKIPEYYQGDIPWISTPYLGNNHINGSSAKAYITEDAIKNSATHLIPANTIMFGIRVGVGKSSIIDEPMCANQDIVALMGIDTNKYNLLFIKHVLDGYQSHFDSIKKGATILGITTDDLKKVMIPVVGSELQNQFATFVEQTDKSKSAIQQSLDKLESLKKSLMQEYFG